MKDPYILRKAGDFVTAKDWNDMQGMIRNALNVHSHSGEVDQGIKLTDAAIDSSSTLTIKGLDVTGDLKVDEGAAMGGALSVKGLFSAEKDITVKGKVGIGTDKPGAALEVAGDVKITGSRLKSKDDFGIVEANKKDWLRINPDKQYPAIALYQPVALGTGGLTIGEWKKDLPQGELKVTQSAFLATAGGNVGIGTTDPKAKLEVNGTIRTSDNLIKDVREIKNVSEKGWYRIAQGAEGDGNRAGIFEIRWAVAGRHGHIRFAVGANFGDDAGAQITVLDQSTYGGKIVEKIRLLMKDDKDTHFVEFYFNGSIHDKYNLNFVVYQYSGYGWTLIDPKKGAVPKGYASRELRSDVLFATRSGTTNGFVVDNNGSLYAGNSDVYFTKTDHNHTGIGNTKGYAAIENAKNFDALMILGRAGTNKGRYVRLWDYLQVNGSMDVTGDIKAKRIETTGDVVIHNPAHGTNLQLRGNGQHAYCHTNKGAWEKMRILMVCSRDLKENIETIPTEEAVDAVTKLRPVKFNYIGTMPLRANLGFIAEEAPDILATEDRKTIAPFDIIPILTSVIKKHQQIITNMQSELSVFKKRLNCNSERIPRPNGGTAGLASEY